MDIGLSVIFVSKELDQHTPYTHHASDARGDGEVDQNYMHTTNHFHFVTLRSTPLSIVAVTVEYQIDTDIDVDIF